MREQQKIPQDVVAVFIAIGEDEQEAKDLVRSLDVWLLGKKEFTEFDRFPSIKTAKEYEISEADIEKVEKKQNTFSLGYEGCSSRKTKKISSRIRIRRVNVHTFSTNNRKKKKYY